MMSDLYIELIDSDSYLDEFIRIHTDFETMKYYGMSHYTIQQVTQLFYNYIESNKNGLSHHYWIVENGVIVGNMGVYSIDRINNKANSYCVIDRNYWATGICTRASKIVYDRIFNETSINRIEAKAEADNVSAIRTLIKTGYSQEGILREYEIKNGKYIDIVIFSLLKSDILNGRN